ncbi:MAG: N-acetyltransferase [Pseudomonadota bacterium]
MFELTPETQNDYWEVEALYDLCFGPGREALSSYRLRDDVDPVASLSRVAKDGGGFVGGAIRFWPVRVGEFPVLLLGPVAVHPTHQGEGLGGALIRDGCAAAAEQGWERMLLVGDAPYYARFGFGKLMDVQMPPPTNPDRVLGLPLREDGWANVSGQVRRWRDPKH